MPSEAWEGFRSKLSPHEGAVGSQLPPGPCNCTVQEISRIPWETVRGGLANGRGTGQAMIQGGGREERLADPVEIKVLVLVEDVVSGSTLSVLAEAGWEELHCPSRATVTYLQASSSQ